eukprot:1296647-Ditylum_brightwellii.AAC.1
MMQDMHVHIFLLQAYTIQTQYIKRALIKSYKMSLQTFLARVNKIIDQLEQFPPRNDGTPQTTVGLYTLEPDIPPVFKDLIRKYERRTLKKDKKD